MSGYKKLNEGLIQNDINDASKNTPKLSQIGAPMNSNENSSIMDDISLDVDNKILNGPSFLFDNIYLSIPGKKGCCSSNKDSNDIHILNGISGKAKCGQLYGIIGASGGGKTTLLGVLSGRISRIESLGSNANVTGNISLGNINVDCKNIHQLNDLREKIAFVLQQDLLFETETARECIEISAQLRLPRYMAKNDKLIYAQNIINALDLANCADTIIGGDKIRGLSGGERKRVSIGSELVTNPQVLLLDECTSGLDSAIAFQTMKLLKKLAMDGKCCIASLHQPSSQIFNLLDKVLILARGKVIFEGNIKHELPAYIESLGKQCPQYSNLADFILMEVHNNPEYWIDKWEQYCNENNYEQKLAENNKNIKDNIEVKSNDMASICVQIHVLFIRQWKLFKRNPVTTFARFGQTVFTAVLQGVLWWQLPDMIPNGDNQGNAQNRFGAIFFATIFAAMNAIMTANLTFPVQRLVFQKERASNYYYTTPYILAKTFIDIPPTALICLIYAVIVKYMVNLRTEWYIIFLVLTLVGYVADGMGFCLGCIAKTPEIATQLTPLTIIPLFLFSNFFVANSQIPKIIQWIKWMDPFYYGGELLCIYEFDGIYPEFLKQFDMDTNNKYRDIYCLIILLVGFRFLAILILMIKNGI